MINSLFLTNTCSFNKCGLCFQNLYDLIQHIEEEHVKANDFYDPPLSSVGPLSAVSRYYARLPSTPARAIKPENIQCSFARRRPSVHYGQANAALHGQYLQQQAGAAAGSVSTGTTSALMSAIRGGGATGGMPMSMGGNMPVNTMSTQSGLPSGGGSATKLSAQAARNRTTPSKSSLPGVTDDDRASMMSGGSDSASIDASDTGSALLHHSTGGERIHSCPECHKRYKAYAGLRYHVKNAHGAEKLAELVQPAKSMPVPRPFKCKMCPKAYKTQSGLTNHTTTSHQLPGVLPGSATAPMSGGQSFVPTSTAMVAPPSPAAGPMAPPPTSAHSMVNMLNTMSTGGNSPTFAGMTTPQRSTSSSSLAAKLVATSSVVSQKMYTHKFQSPGVAAPSPTTGGAQQQQQGVSPATPGTQQQHQMSGGGQIISPPSSATGQQLMFAAPPPAQHSQMAMSTPTGGGLMQQQYQQSPPTTTNTGVPARAPFSSGGTTMLGGSQQQQQPGTGQSPQQQQQHSGPNIMQRKPVNKLYRHLPSTTGGGGGSGSPASGMYTSGTPQSMAGVMQQPSAITTKRYTSARPYTNVVRHVTVQQQQQQPQQHPMPPIAGGAGGLYQPPPVSLSGVFATSPPTSNTSASTSEQAPNQFLDQ